MSNLSATTEIFTSQEIIRNSSTNRLCDMFELCTCLTNPEVPTVRSWLMDEFSRRYPSKMDTWNSLPDKTDADLRTVLCGVTPAVYC